MSLDINLTNVESTTNKSTNVNTDQASNTKYPSVKSVFDWANSAISWIATNGANVLSHLSNTNNPHSTTATQVDALKRDGSNANSDVDLGTYSLNAKSFHVKGTGGNGHLALKHQSSGATAGGSESVIYADNSGNPKWKNDGNAVQDVLLSGTTTADIADSTNKRYVTDAQLTVLGNTSGTNTGDETQSSIFSKLKLAIKKQINYSAVTGTTLETLVGTLIFPANSFESTDNLRILVNTTRSGTTSGIAIVRVKVNSVNDFSTATTIATIATTNSAQNYFSLVRENMFISDGNLQGFPFTTSSLTDIGLLASTLGSAAVDVTQPLFFFVSIQNASTTESNRIRVFKISNI